MEQHGENVTALRRPAAAGGLLILLASLPMLVFLPVWVDDRVGAVLYRQPKYALIQFLGWGFLTFLLLTEGRRLANAFDRSWFRELPIAPALLFVAYSLATVIWARVPINALFEAIQYLLLACLLLALRTWGEVEPRARRWIVGGQVAALGLATVVGLVQLGRPDALPFLAPIDPEKGVPHPSVMGYKNPMALAVLGQIFLLVWLVREARTSRGRRLGLGVLLGLELFYLVTLQSRTAWVALAVAGVFLGFFLWQRPQRTGTRRRLAIGGVLILTGLGLFFALPGPRQRLTTLVSWGADELIALEGDRATYLLNTLVMVRDRPFGVGLGNWQTEYPVYRSHNRYVAFTPEMQVRRAHDDYAQILGETGWHGLVLWLLAVGSAIAVALRRAMKSGDSLSTFLAAQWIAMTVAMAGDFVLEIPSHRLQLFLLFCLVALPPPGETAALQRAPSLRQERVLRGIQAATVLTFLAATAAAGLLLAKSHTAIVARIHYAEVREWERRLSGKGVDDAETRALRSELRRAVARGRGAAQRFGHLPGQDKTFHKDELVFAYLALADDDRTEAIRHATNALRLHPYFPNAFRLLASLVRSHDPRSADLYLEADDYIRHQATKGFRRPYPPLAER